MAEKVEVPFEPTVEMLEALFGGMCCAGQPMPDRIAPARRRYQEMLRLTPLPQQRARQLPETRS